MNYCYLNGRIIPESQAKISVKDIGLLRGLGVFDYLRTYDGRLALAEKHLKRFKNSANIIGLTIPVSQEELKKIILTLIKKNNLKNAGIRLVLTGGESPDGLRFDQGKPTLFILTQELPPLDQTLVTRGVRLITYENQRELCRAKTLNYVTRMSQKAIIDKKKAYEILYVSGGNLLECSTGNFYIFKNDRLITASDNILLGTRRGLILQLAKKRFTIEERPVKVAELKEATEAFVSSTTRGIIPVVSIDEQKIGQGEVGKNTKELIRLFEENILLAK